MDRLSAVILAFITMLTTSCEVDMPESVSKAYQDLPEKIDFNFHVRPILSDRCFHCHGPDEKARKADLRLDIEETAFAALASGHGHAIVSGKPVKSALVKRILSEDPEFIMPTPESKLSLTDHEKATLIKWIEQGAEWKDHWAFIPPQKPPLPKVEAGVEHPIDKFVAQKLAAKGLKFSPEADKERLLRRVTMDLTGLPPTVEEIDAFLNDNSNNAYEKIVDRLLSSEACAERLAMEWMDIARYADSHGMHADGYRFMWPWRDWVIDAFHQNMPYDQFITWQLAGDLLPDASKEQKLATAFHRNHPMTAEGGAVDEEFRLNYVFDRTETTATALLGLTMNCARCHDHKFDPISQKDYYKMTAFFNNVKELGMTGDDGNYGPMLLIADEKTDAQIAKLKKQISQEEKALEKTESQLMTTKDFIQQLPTDFQPGGRIGYFPFDKIIENPKKQFLVDHNPKATASTALKTSDGKKGKALIFRDDYDVVHLSEIGDFEYTEPFSVGVWINTTKRKKLETQTIIGNAGGKNDFWRGWDFYLDSLNQLSVRLIHSLPHNYCQVITKDSIKTSQWTHVGFSYDGSGKASGINIYVNGKKADTKTSYDRLYKSIYPIRGAVHTPYRKPLRTGKSYRSFTGENGIFKGAIDQIEIYNRSLTALEMAFLANDETFNAPANNQLMDYWLDRQPQVKEHRDRLKALREMLLDTLNKIPEVMVMEEMPQPRPAFVYNRGEYDAPIAQVDMGTPEVLPPFSKEYPRNRLGLAKWLFQKDNPLTARVTVNRYWQMLFGQGIVKTPQDFGVQGDLPTHPQLLDWLAVHFMENEWDLKNLLKTIVMSATYRQSSKLNEKLKSLDPENELLARGPSYRLPAEMIRDNALAASGLLVKKVGGASVRPYQPEGLWIEKGNFSHILLRYKETMGDSLYRRSLYTFVKRTSPHPAMTAFDAPNRDICVVKRENTNTPLQSLVLLNDPQFVEAARVLAQRIQLEKEPQLEKQINYAFRLVTGRHLKPVEKELFVGLYQEQLELFKKDKASAAELLSVGEAPIPEELDETKTAALAVVASTMINHDEAYMKR